MPKHLITALNPYGLAQKPGYRITKRGYVKDYKRKVVPEHNINRQPKYQAYKALEERPLGIKPFEKDAKGNMIVHKGELFCRFRELDGNMCQRNRKFSDHGNLKAHVKNRHGMPLIPTHIGASTAVEVIRAEQWYVSVMAEDEKLSAGIATGGSEAVEVEEAEIAAPAEEDSLFVAQDVFASVSLEGDDVGGVGTIVEKQDINPEISDLSDHEDLFDGVEDSVHSIVSRAQSEIASIGT